MFVNNLAKALGKTAAFGIKEVQLGKTAIKRELNMDRIKFTAICAQVISDAKYMYKKEGKIVLNCSPEIKKVVMPLLLKWVAQQVANKRMYGTEATETLAISDADVEQQQESMEISEEDLEKLSKLSPEQLKAVENGATIDEALKQAS